jgi:hypothetical protein
MRSTRRDFMRRIGAGAAGLGLASPGAILGAPYSKGWMFLKL